VENIRRIAEVAKLMMAAGLIVMTAFISPFRRERVMARDLIGAKNFCEVFVNTPLTFRFVTAIGQELGDASKAVVVAQLVLDDGVLKYFMHNRFLFDYVCKNVLWS
jgi:hypothetical protein